MLQPRRFLRKTKWSGVTNPAAVNLNGQPPIQVYARVTPEPFIRIHSIDLGTDCDIREWDELLDYSSAPGEFSLVKAALVLAGFTPAACPSANGSLKDLLKRFGGGLELTTLAAVPKGSGLGTSSIMGAVVVSVISRVTGRALPRRDLLDHEERVLDVFVHRQHRLGGHAPLRFQRFNQLGCFQHGQLAQFFDYCIDVSHIAFQSRRHPRPRMVSAHGP